MLQRTLRLLVCGVFLFVCSGVAFGGPNSGGVLLFHTDNGIVFTEDADYGGMSGPFNPCEENVLGECPDPPADGCGCSWLISDLTTASTKPLGGEASVVWVLAAFPPDACARLKGVSFGITWDNPSDLSIATYGTSATLEIPMVTWPSHSTGNGMVWDQTQFGELVEVYWFGIYAYYQTTLRIIGNPSQGFQAEFGDDSLPSQIDAIALADCGSMGFGGASGNAPVVCLPVPSHDTSWGRIKSSFGR